MAKKIAKGNTDAAANLYNWGRTASNDKNVQEYYRNFFPVDMIREWAVNGHNVEVEGDFKQTFALFANDKIVERYFTPQSSEEFVHALLRHHIDRVEIGPRTKSNGQTISQRLAIDLDSGDYEKVYPGEGSTVESEDGLIKQGAWIMMVLSVGYLGLYLEHVYKLKTPNNKPYLYVFSGRRGAHLWIEGIDRDWFNREAVRELSSTYIPLLRTARGAHTAYEELSKDTYGLSEWFAIISDYAHAALESDFLWTRDQRTTNQFNTALESEFPWVRDLRTRTTDQLAGELSTLLGEAVMPTGDFFRALGNNEKVPASFWHKAGLLLVAPRHDKNVTTSSEHLLKTPFSLHPKTRLVSIPFDPFKTKNHERDNVCLPVDKLVANAQNPVAKAEKQELLELFENARKFIAEPEIISPSAKNEQSEQAPDAMQVDT